MLAWAAGWLLWWAAHAAGAPPVVAVGLALLGSAALAWRCDSAWRRLLAAGGFPLSALVAGPALAGSAAWWLLAAVPLLAVYPPRAWRDAPLFPTPTGALQGLDAVVGTPPRCVLDAGCGLGHGLRALARLWPTAQLHGVEWSPLLARLARWRCPGAVVHRGDMWAHGWAGHDLVYLFQRPESMARAWAKAQRELQPGAWLVSLEFAVPGVPAHACLLGGGRRPLWVYALGAVGQPSTGADAGR